MTVLYDKKLSGASYNRLCSNPHSEASVFIASLPSAQSTVLQSTCITASIGFGAIQIANLNKNTLPDV